MRPLPRSPKLSLKNRGFSLVELSVVVAIISVTATLGLEAAANFVVSNATSVTRDKMLVVDDAVAKFFKVYGRLPCPAIASSVGGTVPEAIPTSSSYGQENCTGIIMVSATLSSPGYNIGSDDGGGIYIGAVPWRALNIPMSYSIDSFGSKINYIVTKNLTVAGTTTGRFGYSAGAASANGIGGIEVRTGILEQPCSTTKCQVLSAPGTAAGAAYLLLSNGADKRGALSERGTATASCPDYTVSANNKRVDTQNCIFGDSSAQTVIQTATGAAAVIPANVFYDNRYNPGLNLVSYFDDVVIWRPKSQL